MLRLFLLAVALGMLVGCRSQSPPGADPFLGSPRIAPPPTGAASGGAAPPYYDHSPNRQVPPERPPASALQGPGYFPGGSNARPVPGATGVPRTEVDAGQSYPRARSNGVYPSGPGYAPGGGATTRVPPPGFTDRSSGAAPSGSGQSGSSSASPGESSAPQQPLDGWDTTGGGPSAEGLASRTLRGRDRVLRTLPPRPESSRPVRSFPASTPTTGGRPSPSRASGSLDIMQLPPADGAAVAPAGSRGIRLVSADGHLPTRPTGAAAEAALSPRYDHAPDYRWLRGRLEHSALDQRWKLRYIPIDGQTDDFGGSVVLVASNELRDFQRDEFVEVRGRILEREPQTGFSPTYEVDSIDRQGG